MKVLASDFDKTLFTKDYLHNIKRINEFVDKGNIFIIVTGRNVVDLTKDIKGYNIKYSYLICNDGGIIFDNKMQVIFRKDVNPKLVKPIFDIIENDDNMMFAAIDTSTSFVKEPVVPANAILGRPYDMEKAKELLDIVLNKFPEVYGYLSDSWLNITDKEVNKGYGLKQIKNILNISNNDIYTIGDNINDISMNNIYNGYAMEESHSELLSVSKGTVKSVADLIDIIYENNNN